MDILSFSRSAFQTSRMHPHLDSRTLSMNQFLIIKQTFHSLSRFYCWYHNRALSHLCMLHKLFNLTLYSDEHIMDFNGNAIISSASVTSFIVSSDDQRKGYVTVTRESCPCGVWRWITISCTVKYHLITLICCLIKRYVCDGWRT